MNELERMLGVLDETIGHRLNGVEWQLKRIADALEAQTLPPPKLYEPNREPGRAPPAPPPKVYEPNRDPRNAIRHK